LTIAGRVIDDTSDAWVIAELGHNHGGSLDTAKAMIRVAAAAGADAVKLQKRSNRELYTDDAYNHPYVSENSYGATYGEHREALEFSSRDYTVLQLEAAAERVALFATPFDACSLAMLVRHGVVALKIASSDVVNLPFLKHAAEFGIPMIVSTGAATQADVDAAVNTIWPINQHLALLQCTAEYPVRVEHLNLNVITTYRERYPDLVIGLSTHYSGISDTIAAYVLGARIFEKHFTLDRTSKGSDHAFSLEPDGFAKMVSYLRKVRLMLGSGDKTMLPGEQAMVAKMRETTRWYTELSQNAIR
jgi:N-acetylneuraminate synthase/sialic acid synthase